MDSTSRHSVALISADQPEWTVIELARLGRRLPRSKIGEASRNVGNQARRSGRALFFAENNRLQKAG
jgi:hypothetical protein